MSCRSLLIILGHSILVNASKSVSLGSAFIDGNIIRTKPFNGFTQLHTQIIRLASSDDKTNTNIDWDAEWKKVVDSKDLNIERPKEPTEAERQLRVLKRQARDAQAQAQSMVSQVPPFKKLQNDWRFWAGIIVGLSLLSAALTSLGTSYIDEPEQLIVYHDALFSPSTIA